MNKRALNTTVIRSPIETDDDPFEKKLILNSFDEFLNFVCNCY